MLRTAPFTLWRSILGELSKLLFLSTAVLVTIVAFAACVKPLSDGMLQAGDLIKFVLLAIPPMLAYALPFAAGFASTLTYYRIAHDHEAEAVHAGGISHRALLMPAVLIAFLLSITLIALNESVIPRFLKEMQRLITVDVARLLAQEIQKGKAVELGGMMIYADQAKSVEPQPGSGVTDQLLLYRFSAIRLDKDRKPVSELTASMATIWLLPEAVRAGDVDPATGLPVREDEGRSRVIVQLENVVAAEKTGVVASQDQIAGWVVPNAFKDKTKFLDWRSLRALKDRPEKMSWIDALRRDLAGSLALAQSVDQMSAEAARGRAIAFVDDRARALTISGGPMTPAGEWRWRLGPAVPGGSVEVRQDEGDGAFTVMNASEVFVTCDPTRQLPEERLKFRLELSGVRVRAATETPDATDPVERAQIFIGPLRLRESPAADLMSLGTPHLIEATEAHLASRPDESMSRLVKDLHNQLGLLGRQVLAKQHQRMALALSCAVMILTGAITALKLSKQLPLTVYLWSFLPAIASLVTISGGDQMTVKMGSVGLVLLWGGVAALGLYTLVVFRSLARH